MVPASIDDFEALAKQILSKEVYDYFAGGASGEVTLRDNRFAYDSMKIIPRVLAGVGSRNLSTSVLGESLSLPVMIAPMGFQGAACSEGELATIRAAQAAGTITVLSTMSNVSLEAAIDATDSPLWFQLYAYKDRSITESLVVRAQAAGYSAIVLTVDTAVLGRRERDIRNQFQFSKDLVAANLVSYGLEKISPEAKGSSIESYVKNMFDDSISWRYIEWLKGITQLPIIIKGLLHPEDAVLAVKHGSSGIIVSNHGGRQLDTTPATINLLPGIVSAVEGKIPVFIDGGIRHGTDIVKAISLGADAVLIGRPVIWGLAMSGERGVYQVMETLRQELDTAMALCGFNSVLSLKNNGKKLIYNRNFTD